MFAPMPIAPHTHGSVAKQNDGKGCSPTKAKAQKKRPAPLQGRANFQVRKAGVTCQAGRTPLPHDGSAVRERQVACPPEGA